MYTGNAVKAWHKLALSDEQYHEFFETLHRKTAEYHGRMRVHFHEMGLLEELRYRLQHPAALLIVLPNGLVKLINALPFVCGDLRRQSLTEIWANFQRAWQDPRVAQFIDDLARDPGKTSTLHQWVHRMSTLRARPLARSDVSPPIGCWRSAASCAIASSSTPACCPIGLGAAWAYATTGVLDARDFLERASRASCSR